VEERRSEGRASRRRSSSSSGSLAPLCCCDARGVGITSAAILTRNADAAYADGSIAARLSFKFLRLQFAASASGGGGGGGGGGAD